MTEAEFEKLARSLRQSYGTELSITDYSNCTEKFLLYIHPLPKELFAKNTIEYLRYNVIIYEETLRFRTIFDEWYIIPMSNVKRIIIKK